MIEATTVADILSNYQPPETPFITPQSTANFEAGQYDDAAVSGDEDDDNGSDTFDGHNSYPNRTISPELISAPTKLRRGSAQSATTTLYAAQPYSEIYKSGLQVPEAASRSSRPTKVVHIDYAPPLSSAGVRGLVTNVSHGTFHSQPATLVVFSFRFRSGDHGFRFKKTNVKITFANPRGTPASQPSPVVRKFAPRKIFGLPTTEGKKNTIGGEVSLQVPVGQLTVGPAIHGEKEWEYMKEYRYGTVGNFWSSKYGSDWDIVYWETRENKRTQGGLPDTLNCAVIVEREGSFTASVEVTVDTPFMNGPFAYPWTKNGPVVFVPGITTGELPRTTIFDDLTTEDWKALVPYQGEWENQLIEESMSRSISIASGTVTPVVERETSGGIGSPDQRKVEDGALDAQEHADK